MNTLIRHIEYLLSRKDCVIIPGVGAILATRVSAKYDQATFKILPPKRIFIFNGDLQHNDGLIVTSIQRNEGISYEAALQKLHCCIESLKSALSSNGRVTLGCIGDLVRDETDGTLSFKAHNDDLSVESLWLKPVSTPLQPKYGGQIIDSPIKSYYRNRMLRIAKVAASFLILIAIGFIASTPIPVDDATLASLVPEISQVDMAEIVPQKQQVNTLSIISATKIYDEPDINSTPAPLSSNYYYVIVATLANRAEAEKYLTLHPDPQLRISNRGRYYTIYSSMHTDVYEAYGQAQKIRDKYPDAWVLK